MGSFPIDDQLPQWGVPNITFLLHIKCGARYPFPKELYEEAPGENQKHNIWTK